MKVWDPAGIDRRGISWSYTLFLQVIKNKDTKSAKSGLMSGSN